MFSQLTSTDFTTLPTQYFQSLGLRCHRSDGLELIRGQSSIPSIQQQQFQTTVEYQFIWTPPLSTHSAVEMQHGSVLYKLMADIGRVQYEW